eukprot:CAMPEP_0197388434 /NCGR_PEP_ID=MMETSP1165-20131217/1072_1 /TAXON_ID=284809 /ORGANISM="Chrysocystis fragilis, Strain CCMP3189" /LENGTH=201 /DNA_ID=CAMNT_0042913781 /DNA_START=33 /DNA_END=638 /DNA_ORIENTATION=+
MVKVWFLAVAVAVDAKSIFEAMVEEGKSRSRHATWHAESETALNAHIALEYAAGYQYRALAAFANRDWVNLKGSAKAFEENAKEEFEHARELSEYQQKRGGLVELKALEAPVHEFAATTDKSDARVAWESALALEKRVYDSLLSVHAVCGRHADPNCEDTIEAYLEDQVSAIDKLARYVADLNRVGTDGHAVWEWDREVHE